MASNGIEYSIHCPYCNSLWRRTAKHNKPHPHEEGECTACTHRFTAAECVVMPVVRAGEYAASPLPDALPMASDTEETESLQAAIDRLGIAIYVGRPARGELRPYIAFSYVADYEDAPNKELAFMDDIATLLTAYEAREADSKRLDYLETRRKSWSTPRDTRIETWGIAQEYEDDDTALDATVRSVIDAALSGSPNE